MTTAVQYQLWLHCKAHLWSDVANDLMLLAFSTGIMDVVTFPDYKVFASNQTGNTALLAVGALDLTDGTISLRHVGVSLGTFALGGLVSGQVGNLVGQERRIWLLSTNLFQTFLVLAAAVLHTRVDDYPSRWIDDGIITLLAFASGCQVAMARTVHVPEVTTAMVTSAYIDFMVDPKIFQLHNRPRDRRFVFVCSLLLGSFVGALGYLYVNPAFALYISALGKLLVSVGFLFNRRKKPPDTDIPETDIEEACKAT